MSTPDWPESMRKAYLRGKADGVRHAAAMAQKQRDDWPYTHIGDINIPAWLLGFRDLLTAEAEKIESGE
jgi:hypothetical protein